MPLRQIKQHVRSSRSDVDFNDCATPSPVPEISSRQYWAQEFEIFDNDHYQAREQVTELNLPYYSNLKRVRGHGDHDWLPSDLLGVSHTESSNEAKRIRGNSNYEYLNGLSQAGDEITTDMSLTSSAELSAGTGVQVQIQNPLIDVNQAIQEMPQETADAFKELIRLVGPFNARASRAADEMQNWHPLSNDIEYSDSPPPPPPFNTDESGAFEELIQLVGSFEARGSQAGDEMKNWGPFTDDLPLPPVTSDENGALNEEIRLTGPPVTTYVSQQSSRAVDEMESKCSITTDLHQQAPTTPPPPETDPLQSERSATTSELLQTDSPTFSTTDFWPNDSPPLATVDQPVCLQGGAVQSECRNRSECSPHPVAICKQQYAGKGASNADVVLYEPKPEPVESLGDTNRLGSVVHVKQEQDLNFEPTPDPVSIRPREEHVALRQIYSNRKLIHTALETFEAVRKHIIMNPSYGQPVVEVQTPGTEGHNKRLRADLKAAALMRSKGFWLNETVRPIGEVPGVPVGQCFRYRIEMAVIGLHRAVQAGIAVVPVKYSPYGVTVASSVVLGVSDPYHDDHDMGDRVIYSGQGGLCGRTKESQDQELKRGNLALSNSYERKLPVRLIRGHKEQNSMTGILYSYDGLYEIVSMAYQKGVNGKKVYKFTMHRLPGQAPLSAGYPAPLESQPPATPAREPAPKAVHWTESSDTKPLYIEKRPVA